MMNFGKAKLQLGRSWTTTDLRPLRTRRCAIPFKMNQNHCGIISVRLALHSISKLYISTWLLITSTLIRRAICPYRFVIISQISFKLLPSSIKSPICSMACWSENSFHNPSEARTKKGTVASSLIGGETYGTQVIWSPSAFEEGRKVRWWWSKKKEERRIRSKNKNQEEESRNKKKTQQGASRSKQKQEEKQEEAKRLFFQKKKERKTKPYRIVRMILLGKR